MAITYLYIDDEKQKAEGIIKPLLDTDLVFKVEKPLTWNLQKAHLIDKSELEKYDGLLLDLKLEFTDENNNEIKFSGADLAQTIRSDVKAGKIKDLPIFLCSTDLNMMNFFDRTSIDLFDKCYSKNKNLVEEKTKYELISFAKAYKNATDDPSIETLMKKASFEELRALQAECKDFKTPHEFVYLINRYVIQSTGMLIDEYLLSIRLGIDIAKSPDWDRVKTELLKNFKYYGILGDFYERWWQSEVLKWWKESFGKSLIVMTAKEKVNSLVEKFKFDLSYLSLPEYHRFDTFWYKCRLSKIPLDPSDALRTIEMPRYVWQEPSYISLAYIKSEDRDKESITSLLGTNEMGIFEDL